MYNPALLSPQSSANNHMEEDKWQHPQKSKTSEVPGCVGNSQHSTGGFGNLWMQSWESKRRHCFQRTSAGLQWVWAYSCLFVLFNDLFVFSHQKWYKNFSQTTPKKLNFSSYFGPFAQFPRILRDIIFSSNNIQGWGPVAVPVNPLHSPRTNYTYTADNPRTSIHYLNKWAVSFTVGLFNYISFVKLSGGSFQNVSAGCCKRLLWLFFVFFQRLHAFGHCFLWISNYFCHYKSTDWNNLVWVR